MRVSEVSESTSGSKVTVKVVDTPLAKESTVKLENTKSRTLAPLIDKAKSRRAMVSLPTFLIMKVFTTGGVSVTTPKLIVFAPLVRIRLGVGGVVGGVMTNST